MPSYSFSKLDNYDTCPAQYYRKYVLFDKNMWVSGPEADWGNLIHDQAEQYIKTRAPMTAGAEIYQQIVDRKIQGFDHVFAELVVHINSAYEPCDPKDPDRFLTGKIDFMGMSNSDLQAVSIKDWKTGKFYPKPEQLAFYSVLIASILDVNWISGELVFFKGDKSAKEVYSLDDVRIAKGVIERKIGNIERATAYNNFPPKQNFLCRKHCANLHCPFNGRRIQ